MALVAVVVAAGCHLAAGPECLRGSKGFVVVVPATRRLGSPAGALWRPMRTLGCSKPMEFAQVVGQPEVVGLGWPTTVLVAALAVVGRY